MTASNLHRPCQPIMPKLASNRRAAATIEFAMAMPFIFLLLVGLTWLGHTMLAHAEVKIMARHLAWKQRMENPDAAAFVFATSPGYHGENDYASEESLRTVKISTLYKSEPPSAEESVLIGSWDHRDLTLDKFPNWDLYRRAALGSTTGNLQSLLGGIGNFRNILSNINIGSLGSLFGIGFTPPGDLVRDSVGGKSQAEKQADEDKAEEREKLMQRRTELERQIAPLRPLARAGVLSAKQRRKYYRLEKELSDVVEDLQEL